MSKLDRIALAFNSDLAAQRGDEINKLIAAVRGAGSLETAMREVQRIHNNYFNVEMSKETMFRRQYETTRAL